MSILCKISENGECASCKKNVGNAYVTCSFCQESFHAFSCSAPESICTSSFHQLYKPLNAKTGVNAERPGKFMFACDTCLTKYEINKVQTDNNKIEVLQKQVSNLERGLEDIKSLLIDKHVNHAPMASKSGCNGNFSNIAMLSGNAVANNNAWSPENVKRLHNHSTNNISIQDSNIGSTNCSPQNEVNKTATSALIIERCEDDIAEKENLDKIEEVIVKQKIDIVNSFKNHSGKTVIICKSSEQRNGLKSKISSVIPTLLIKAVGNLNKSMVVAGFNRNYTEGNIVDTLVDHNGFISSFLALKSSTSDDHIAVINVKPLKKEPSLSQVYLKVSSELRKLIVEHGDKLRVGMKRCPVYERHFVKRCFGCQQYGHFHAQCPTKNIFCCSNCAGDHETQHCKAPAANFKCVNCMRAGRSENINHPASSLECPVFIQEVNKVKDNSKN